jgi:hypothetical protein
MNTQETLDKLVKRFEERIQKDQFLPQTDIITAYCLAVIARSLTR